MSAAEPGAGAGPGPRSSVAARSAAAPIAASARHAAGGSLAPAGIVLLVALTITWGVNWPMMKLALLEVPPWTFRSLCLMVGGGALLALALASGGPVTMPVRRLPALALVSLFNITGWHLFSAYALLYTGSGRAAIIGYTMPLWASLLSLWVFHARPSARQIAALLLGMAALVLLIVKDFGVLGAAPTGALLMLGAALCWAIGTVLVKKFAWDRLAITALTGWQQLIGGVPIVIGWWLLEPVPDLRALSLPAALGLAYAVFVAMIFCHTAYFKLLSLLPAHVAAISVLPVPVVGVVSSAILLAEPVGVAEIAALALVVGGLFLLVRPADR
jgi:drug/metabolite transporter (DMT)-like permease